MNQVKEHNEFIEVSSLFKVRFSKTSERFHCFNIIPEKIAPVLRDLTESYRGNNWKLHFSAVSYLRPYALLLTRLIINTVAITS